MPHVRIPKHFVLEERLERYAAAIELAPAALAGRWVESCTPLGSPAFAEVRLDLGCGKGVFACEAAAAEPDVLFVAVDSEPICIAYAAQRVCEARLANVVVVPWDGMRVGELFGPGEVSRVYLNFPTPFPRKKEARLRLTSAARLMDLRRILAPGGTVALRTDSAPLFDFSLAQLRPAGYELLHVTRDLRAEDPDSPGSEYERKLVERGAKVHAYVATPGPEPRPFVEPEPESLMDYLPADLTSLDGEYVPHGMAGAIENFRNRDLHRAARGEL